MPTKGKRQSRGAGSIRTLPSGRHQAKVKVDGVYYPAPHTFDTKQAATIWLNNQNRAIAAGTWQPPVKDDAPDAGRVPLFATFAETFLAERDLKPRTREHYRKLLDGRLLPDWGRVRLDRITVNDVSTWYATLNPATPTMRSHTYALLRTILNEAWRRDLIGANPCRVRGGGSVKRASRTRVPSAEQIHALADAMPGQYKPMVLMAAWCGMRFGELTELRGPDFTLNAEGLPVTVSMERGVVRVHGEYLIGTTKNDGVRDVVIPPHIRADVAPWVKDAGAGLIFHGRNGGNMASSSLYWHFGKAREAVGLPGFRWHDLRHFSGTTAAQVGATPAEVMDRLGHTTMQAAMRYQHAASGRDALVAEALSNVVPLRKPS